MDHRINAAGELRFHRRIPNTFVLYFVPLILAASLTGILDALLIVPMVEIDPSLTFVVNRSDLLQSIRDIVPSLAPPILIVSLMIIEVIHTRRELREDPYSPAARTRILRAPRRLGILVAMGWVLAITISVGIDIVTLRFPVPGEALMYYLSSLIAMGSTAAFGYLLTHALIGEINRRVLVPFVFSGRDGVPQE